jgi:hypothetical protein
MSAKKLTITQKELEDSGRALRSSGETTHPLTRAQSQKAKKNYEKMKKEGQLTEERMKQLEVIFDEFPFRGGRTRKRKRRKRRRRRKTKKKRKSRRKKRSRRRRRN